MASWADTADLIGCVLRKRIGLGQLRRGKPTTFDQVSVNRQDLTDQRHVLVCQAGPTMLFQKGAHVFQSRQDLHRLLRFAAGEIEKQGCEFDRVGACLFTVGSPVASMIASEQSGWSRQQAKRVLQVGCPFSLPIRNGRLQLPLNEI